MKYVLLSLVCLLPLFSDCPSVPQETKKHPGELIIVGGGSTPREAVKKAIAFAGGPKAHVVILPQASSRKNRGEGSRDMFVEAGALNVSIAKDLGTKKSKNLVETADLIWMPGGSQNRLMDDIKKAKLLEMIRAKHQSGTVIGGTSAGAAVQSKLMITGDAVRDAIRSRGTELAEGLGLVDQLIVDQHAVRRRRFNRLLSAVLDNPKTLGMAIDERTAAIIQGKKVTVVGTSSVLIIDARKATIVKPEEGQPHGATGLTLHVLKKGLTFTL